MTDLTKDDEYEIIVKHMSSITSLRKFANQQSFELLEGISEKLTSILAERKEEEELRKIELQELEDKRLKALAYLEEIGLSPDELKISVFEGEPKRKKAKNSTPRAAKYSHTDESGKTHYWTGVGRMSNHFKDLIDSGRNIDEFLIQQA